MPRDLVGFHKPTATIKSRQNVGDKYLDKSKQLPPCQVDRKESTLASAIDWVRKCGDKGRVYKIFVDKILVKELAWNDKQAWHQVAKRYQTGCPCCGPIIDRNRESVRLGSDD
jgi:hypothetical protein